MYKKAIHFELYSGVDIRGLAKYLVKFKCDSKTCLVDKRTIEKAKKTLKRDLSDFILYFNGILSVPSRMQNDR